MSGGAVVRFNVTMKKWEKCFCWYYNPTYITMIQWCTCIMLKGIEPLNFFFFLFFFPTHTILMSSLLSSFWGRNILYLFSFVCSLFLNKRWKATSLALEIESSYIIETHTQSWQRKKAFCDFLKGNLTLFFSVCVL